MAVNLVTQMQVLAEILVINVSKQRSALVHIQSVAEALLYLSDPELSLMLPPMFVLGFCQFGCLK